MNGFTNSGGFTIKSPFGDLAKRVERAAAAAPQRVSSNMDRVFGRLEDDVRDAIREHPAWPNEIADKTSVKAVDGEFELQVDDERMPGLEFGRDPQKAPASLVAPLFQQRRLDVEDDLSVAVARGVGL